MMSSYVVVLVILLQTLVNCFITEECSQDVRILQSKGKKRLNL